MVAYLPQFQLANFEATTKILGAMFGGMPVVSPHSQPCDGALIPHESATLPRILVQAVYETLLPVIPHIDDYACLICTSIAFKPIRLACGHMFCVRYVVLQCARRPFHHAISRCLVKLQKRGNDNCPMCRAPTVLEANRGECRTFIFSKPPIH
jgi:hypothetical protein